MSDNRQLSKAEYEQIGRSLETVIAIGYADKKRMLINSFLRGIATGLGSVVGATIIFVLLVWTLSLFSDIPLIGDVIQNAKTTIQETPTK